MCVHPAMVIHRDSAQLFMPDVRRDSASDATGGSSSQGSRQCGGASASNSPGRGRGGGATDPRQSQEKGKGRNSAPNPQAQDTHTSWVGSSSSAPPTLPGSGPAPSPSQGQGATPAPLGAEPLSLSSSRALVTRAQEPRKPRDPTPGADDWEAGRTLASGMPSSHSDDEGSWLDKDSLFNPAPAPATVPRPQLDGHVRAWLTVLFDTQSCRGDPDPRNDPDDAPMPSSSHTLQEGGDSAMAESDMASDVQSQPRRRSHSPDEPSRQQRARSTVAECAPELEIQTEDPSDPPVGIDFKHRNVTGNPLMDFVYAVGDGIFRWSPVVDAFGSEEHLNESSRDMVVLRRANLAYGVPHTLEETCPSIIRALYRDKADKTHACVRLRTIDPAIWLPAMRMAWRQPGASAHSTAKRGSRNISWSVTRNWHRWIHFPTVTPLWACACGVKG